MEQRQGAVEGLVSTQSRRSSPDPSFWRGRRVFVTGHTGFKGAWLCLLLTRWGAEVHGFALAPAAGDLFNTAAVEGALARSTIGDVRDLADVEGAINAAEPEIVLHLAAQALVRPSYDDPIGTYATNVMGTVHVLDAVRRRASVRAAVVVTSDKCYENREWVWGYREDEPMGGYDPYSNSKGCAELATSAYRRSFFGRDGTARLGSGRAGNVIGGGDWAADRLVPDLIRAVRAGRSTLIRNPAAIRPWQHVLEPLAGYLALAEALCGAEGADYAEGFNFGPEPGSERTVGEIADAVCARWGAGAGWTRDTGAHVHEAHFLKLDSSKARARLGWRPRWAFERTLDETVGWYRAQADGRDMADFTLNQIDRYFTSVQELAT